MSKTEGLSRQDSYPAERVEKAETEINFSTSAQATPSNFMVRVPVGKPIGAELQVGGTRHEPGSSFSQSLKNSQLRLNLVLSGFLLQHSEEILKEAPAEGKEGIREVAQHMTRSFILQKMQEMALQS